MSTREQQARTIIATRAQNARAMEPEIAAWQREIGPTPSTHEIAISPLNVPLEVGADMDALRRARDGTIYKHNAIDVFAQKGIPRSDVRVVAAVSGRVLFVGEWDPASGYTVFIGGVDGRIYSYAHLESSTLQVGQSVAQGAIIGAYGNSGNARNDEGGNLHYTVRAPIPVNNPAQTNTIVSVSSQLQPNLLATDEAVISEASTPSRLSDFMKVWPTINGVEARTGTTIFQPGVPVPSAIAQTARRESPIGEALPLVQGSAAGPVIALPSNVTGGESCMAPTGPAPCPISTNAQPDGRVPS